jgi:carboxyl-terminal processing protease
MQRVRPLNILLIALFAFQSVANGQQAQQTPTIAPPQILKPEASKPIDVSAVERRRESFEIVWRTVEENHFDPTFGGVDWNAVHAEFAPRVERAQSDRELHLLLQQMLNRLGQSHFNIIPPESIPSTDDKEPDDGPDSGGDAPDISKHHVRGNLDLAEHMTYGIGIDLRVIGGATIITRVELASTAERAGLRPGFVLRSIGGRTLASILRMFDRVSVFEPTVRHQLPAEILIDFVNGPPRTSVSLTYLDGRNRLRRAVVARERLSGELTPLSQTLPAQFVEFESRRLRDGVGYIRFNLFAAPVLEKFCAALRSMRDAPGVVIDLRGNRGGLMALIYGLGGLLETRAASFGVMRTRAGWFEFRVIPQRTAYRGQIVVLIDSGTESAGEIFAGGLQDSGRAVVIGERSAGATLPSAVKELPTGAILQYAFADFVTANGNAIEGRGVRPNIPVQLSRRSLLGGHDTQLEAAIGAIETRGGRDTLAPPPQVADIIVAGDLPRANSGTKANAEGAKDTTTGAGVDPLVEPIIEKFVEAVGGRAAFERLSSRVSKGTFEGSLGGAKAAGTVEILEKSPDKYASLINVPGFGIMRRAFTGEYGYQQIPLFGFQRLEGDELADLKLTSGFNWFVNLKRLYPTMTLKGHEKVGDADAFVVEAKPSEGSTTKLYFDAHTGLLVRKDKTYFDDYREVDGVKLPFTIRDDFSVIRLNEVKHNLPVEDARFAEEKNCFTQ